MAEYKIFKNTGDGSREVVKNGWSWPAFLFTGIWVIVKGLWLHLIIVVACYSFFTIIWLNSYYEFNPIYNILQLGISILYGVLGNSLYENKLLKNKYKLEKTVVATSIDEALKNISCKNEKSYSFKETIQSGSYPPWKCSKCGTKNEKGTIVCSNCAGERETFSEDYSIEEKIGQIKDKMNGIIKLREITKKIEDESSSILLKRQTEVLDYLSTYYEKYCLALFAKEVENKSLAIIQDYKDNQDVASLYASLQNMINTEYQRFSNDVLLKDKLKLTNQKDKYFENINMILKKELIESTNKIIQNISPITDKHEFIYEVQESFTCEVDIEKLNEAYDKFNAELTLNSQDF